MRVTYDTSRNTVEVAGSTMSLAELERLIRVLQEMRRRMLKEART